MVDHWPRRREEIEIALEASELRFNPATGMYERAEGPDPVDDLDFTSEQIAAQLGVSVDELNRYETEVCRQEG